MARKKIKIFKGFFRGLKTSEFCSFEGMKNVFLIGYMGVGKTTIGKKLANRLGLEFVDLDAVIEQDQKQNISEIIRTQGEKHFREIEEEKLIEISKKNNLLISTGGGTPCFHNNMDVILENGVSIYLKMDEKSLVNRLEKNTESRPLIAGKNRMELEAFVTQHLQERKSHYERADLQFEMLNVNAARLNDLVEEIRIKSKD